MSMKRLAVITAVGSHNSFGYNNTVSYLNSELNSLNNNNNNNNNNNIKSGHQGLQTMRPGANLHGNVNIMLGGAMLSLVITIVCFVCYCCHRNIKKRTASVYRQQWFETDGNMEIYSVEQCYDTTGLFLEQTTDNNNSNITLTHHNNGPPPAYEMVVALDELAAVEAERRKNSMDIDHCMSDSDLNFPNDYCDIYIDEDMKDMGGGVNCSLNGSSGGSGGSSTMIDRNGNLLEGSNNWRIINGKNSINNNLSCNCLLMRNENVPNRCRNCGQYLERSIIYNKDSDNNNKNTLNDQYCNKIIDANQNTPSTSQSYINTITTSTTTTAATTMPTNDDNLQSTSLPSRSNAAAAAAGATMTNLTPSGSPLSATTTSSSSPSAAAELAEATDINFINNNNNINEDNCNLNNHNSSNHNINETQQLQHMLQHCHNLQQQNNSNNNNNNHHQQQQQQLQLYHQFHQSHHTHELGLRNLNENGLIRMDMSQIIDNTGLPTYEAALKLESSGYV